MRITSLLIPVVLGGLIIVGMAAGQTIKPATSAAVMTGERISPAAEMLAVSITETLGRASIKVVDRSQISKLLSEHQLSVSGAMGDPLAIGKMTGAQYLIYLASPHAAEEAAPATQVALMLIEVNSGNVLAEGMCKPADAEPITKALIGAIDQAQQHADEPAATVLSVIDRSDSQRMRFLQDPIAGTLDRLLEQRGWRVLRRRHALELSKETTLSTAGLMRPDAEVLARAADLVVSVEYREQLASDKAFEDTPIVLTLSIKRSGKTSEKQITFTLATMDQLGRALRDALPNGEDKSVDTQTPATGDENKLDPKLEAAQLLAKLNHGLAVYMKPADRDLRAELCRRIVYLDPSAAEAYYWLGATQQWAWHHDAPIGQQRKLAEEGRYALSRYLQFPRNDAKQVCSAFDILQETISQLLDLYKDDPQKMDQLREEGMAIAADYTDWFTSVDWDGKPWGGATKLPTIGNGSLFVGWLNRQPQRKAKFYGWVAQRVRANDSLTERLQRSAEFEAAVAYDKAGDMQNAADYFRRAVSYLQPHDRSYPLFPYCRSSYPDTYPKPATVERYAAYYTAEQKQMLLERLTKPKAEDPKVTPMVQMYGDYYGKIYDKDSVTRDHLGDAIWAGHHKVEREQISPQPLPVPAGLVFMTQLFNTGDQLWLVGVSGSTKSSSHMAYALYRMQLYGGGPTGAWVKAAIPDQLVKPNISWASSRTWVEGALDISMMVRVGDEVLWCGGAIKDGQPVDRRGHETPLPLFVYNFKTDQFRVIDMAAGLPENRVIGVHHGADGRSAWVVTESGFPTRYRDGKLYLSAKPNWSLIGWTFAPDKTLALDSPGEHALWIGGPGAVDMHRVQSFAAVERRMPTGGYFKALGGFREIQADNWTSTMGDATTVVGDGDSLTVIGDKVYMPSGYGLIVMDGGGQYQYMWRKPLFCYFNNLAGYLSANSPLPAAPVVKVVADPQRPNRLWIVSRSQEMAAHIGDAQIVEELKKRGLPFKHGERPPDSMIEYHKTPHDYGLFITALDTDTGKWSKPIFVGGAIAAAAQTRDAWVFAGLGLWQLPKTRWVCDQTFDPSAKPQLITTDTLHGEAAKALFDGDVKETRRLLQQAIEDGVAVKQTQSIVRQLDMWERRMEILNRRR